MSLEAEPSVLEYARAHGLAYHHRGTNPLANLGLMDDRSFEPFEDLPDGFLLDEFNACLSTETLSFGKDAMSILASITAPQRPEDGDVGLEVRRSRKLKLDLPLVRTDHELDMIEFRRRMDPDLKKELLPMEAIDEEADEGFTWPAKYHGLIDELAKQFESETLAVSNEALLCLRDALRLSSETEKHEWNDDEVIPYKRVRVSYSLSILEGTEINFKMQNTARDPVTPPLLPLSPPFLPFVPSSETGHLDLLSDHSSPTHQQAVEVNRLLNDQDAIVPQKRKREAASEGSDPVTYDIADVEDFYSPLRGICDTPSSPPTERKSLQNRKVEGPLTPLPFEPHLPSKSGKIPYNEALREMIPELPPLIAKNDDISSDDIETFFAEVIAPIGIKVARSIEQEQLQAADTECRVPVPIMDFSRPPIPWKSFGGSDSSKNMLSEIKRTHLSKHAWPGVGKTE